jgi:hypothetical protein
MLSLTWNWQSQLLSIDWPFSSTPCLSLAFDTYPGSSHGLRNEMHICLKRLHKLIQCSRFFLAREQKYLCLMKTGEP